MMQRLKNVLIIALLFELLTSSTGAAGMGGEGLELSRIQQREIYFDVNNLGSIQTAPPGFVAKVGEVLPSGLEIRSLPNSAINHVPSLKTYRYAILYYFGMLTGELLLLNPTDREIAAVITP